MSSSKFTSWSSAIGKTLGKGARSIDTESLVTGERRVEFHEQGADLIPSALNQLVSGQPNRIRTAKFTLATWIPLSLLWQFQRIANNYFLVIAVLVLALGEDSPKDWKSKIVPFVGVLFWTACKDLHEDRRRKKDDEIENSKPCKRFDLETKRFQDTQWRNVLTGDIVWIMCDEDFPADLIVLRTAHNFQAFISTTTLDGETSLKERRAPAVCDVVSEVQSRRQREQSPATTHSTQGIHGASREMSHDDEDRALRYLHRVHAVGLTVKMGKPEAQVGSVKGSIRTDYTVDPCPVNNEHFLPRGCYLRNTPWILGVVVYAGDETKTRLNNAKVSSKFSNMQSHLNTCIWGLLIVLFAICVYASLRSVLADADREGVPFELDMLWGGDIEEPFIKKLAIYMVTFYHVVPMSLYVCFEMLKLTLGLRINLDTQMVDPDSKVGAMARTADLVEELGQISFLFSDKTGTLTRNEMVFARCSIGGQDLGDFRASDDETPVGVSNSHQLMRGGPQAASSTHLLSLDAENVSWFFTCMAICHSISVERGKMGDGDLQFLGPSPDEVALVAASHKVGVSFEHRLRQHGTSSNELSLRGPGDQVRVFTVVHELEFNSDRRRMSVVCKHNNEILLVTKGADSVMATLLDAPLCQGTQDNLKLFSQQGLRTLVIGSKVLGPEYFKSWDKRYRAALNLTDATRDDLVMEVAAELETDLRFAGISAVEDRLQEGVPQAIETLKEAGIKVWVLTGDKTETAVDIAHSCNLFTDSTLKAYATEATSVESALEMLQQAKQDLAETQDGGFILDGTTVLHALSSQTCRRLIYDIGLASRSCVCCRLSPLQKRHLVELVRQLDPTTITLAIGDGANDVPMIEGAHVGIGIRGKEGAQAVQVSDIAISQFRFLVPLLMCHGRRAYRRVAVFLCYYLYKNVALAFADIVWMHQNVFRTKRFNGGIAFPEYVSVGYNVLFTSWHVLIVLGYDDDVPDAVSNAHPEAYFVGPERALFNLRVFGKWCLFSMYHGSITWLVPNALLGGDPSDYRKDEPSDFWVGSITSFSILTFVVVLRLLLVSYGPLRYQSILPSLVSVLLYFMVLGVIGYTGIGISFQPCMEGIPGEMLADSMALTLLAALPFAILLVDVADQAICSVIWPTELDKLRQRSHLGPQPE